MIPHPKKKKEWISGWGKSRERADIAGVQGAGSRLGVRPPPACGSDWLKESHRSSPSAALLLSWLRQACSHTALGNLYLCVFSLIICHLLSTNSLTCYSWTFPNVAGNTSRAWMWMVRLREEFCLPKDFALMYHCFGWSNIQWICYAMK